MLTACHFDRILHWNWLLSSYTTGSFVLTVVTTTYFYISFLEIIFKGKNTRHLYYNHYRRKQIYVYITAQLFLFLINVLYTLKCLNWEINSLFLSYDWQIYLERTIQNFFQMALQSNYQTKYLVVLSLQLHWSSYIQDWYYIIRFLKSSNFKPGSRQM